MCVFTWVLLKIVYCILEWNIKGTKTITVLANCLKCTIRIITTAFSHARQKRKLTVYTVKTQYLIPLTKNQWFSHETAQYNSRQYYPPYGTTVLLDTVQYAMVWRRNTGRCHWNWIYVSLSLDSTVLLSLHNLTPFPVLSHCCLRD